MAGGDSVQLTQLQGPGAAADGNGTVADTAGWNGAQMVRVKNMGTGTCTLTLEGAMDSNAATWFLLGYQQVDGVTAITRAASGISVAATPFAHVYQILDAYPQIRARISATAGSTAVDVLLYEVA